MAELSQLGLSLLWWDKFSLTIVLPNNLDNWHASGYDIDIHFATNLLDK